MTIAWHKFFSIGLIFFISLSNNVFCLCSEKFREIICKTLPEHPYISNATKSKVKEYLLRCKQNTLLMNLGVSIINVDKNLCYYGKTQPYIDSSIKYIHFLQLLIMRYQREYDGFDRMIFINETDSMLDHLRDLIENIRFYQGF